MEKIGALSIFSKAPLKAATGFRAHRLEPALPVERFVTASPRCLYQGRIVRADLLEYAALFIKFGFSKKIGDTCWARGVFVSAEER